MSTKKENIFVIDDDKSIRWILDKALKKAGFEVTCFENADSVLTNIRKSEPSVIISDVRMPGESGIEMLENVKREYPKIPIIIMTAFSDLDTTVNSLQKGAYDYITKPFDIVETISLIKKCSRNIPSNKENKKIELSKNTSKIIGNSESMQDIYKSIGKIASTNVDVLILGETGTGKELIARSIHENSERKNSPFIVINTGAIPIELLESELFGHEKGSFTGAYNQRIGRFEQASEGTLFLDEIGDMPMDVQTRLLRVLQEGEFFRVGGTKSIKVKTRIITATHQNLQSLVAKDLFREDLLHRINAIKIELPSLRDRKDDILKLSESFLIEYSKEYKTSLKVLDEDVQKIFQKYYWPGNIRELQNVCKYLSIMIKGNKVLAEDLPKEILEPATQVTETKNWSSVLEAWILNEYDNNSLDISKSINDIFEDTLIKSALRLSKGNKTEAAKILGWGRNTISNKIKSLKK